VSRAAGKLMLWLLVAAFAIPALAFGQDTLWNTWRQGGLQALHEGRLADAERLLTAALEQAEKYGLEDLPTIPVSAPQSKTSASSTPRRSAIERRSRSSNVHWLSI